MKNSRARRDDELGVIISLAIAFGMVIATVAAMWVSSIVSKDAAIVMSPRTFDTPLVPSKGEIASDISRKESRE
ncbi:MAG TPA: hypothetical protein VK901_08035 [Nitrospiraceae bacterium]|nr:hypothetical protein [Nitrospiraceae bacterium]